MSGPCQGMTSYECTQYPVPTVWPRPTTQNASSNNEWRKKVNCTVHSRQPSSVPWYIWYVLCTGCSESDLYVLVRNIGTETWNVTLRKLLLFFLINLRLLCFFCFNFLSLRVQNDPPNYDFFLKMKRRFLLFLFTLLRKYDFLCQNAPGNCYICTEITFSSAFRYSAMFKAVQKKKKDNFRFGAFMTWSDFDCMSCQMYRSPAHTSRLKRIFNFAHFFMSDEVIV